MKKQRKLLLTFLGILFCLCISLPVSADAGNWVKSKTRWWYREADGSYPVSSWKQVDNEWYHFDGDGWMQTGWQKISGSWYYLDGSGKMRTGWQRVDGSWYYLDESGKMRTGWQRVDGSWYYLDGSGKMRTGWQRVDGSWYYLDGSGKMRTDWQKISGSWYYLDGSGKMQTGWQSIGGDWYYLDGSGKMRTGWQSIGGSWYYLDGSGKMRTDWQKIGGSWYYLDGSGKMLTGWQSIGGSWYYLDGSGKMRTGWQSIGGKWYYLYENGQMASGTWIGEYYVNSSGVWEPGKKKGDISQGWIHSGNRWWYKEADGTYPKDCWKDIGGVRYRFDKEGWMVTGWITVDGVKYYMNSSGALAQTGPIGDITECLITGSSVAVTADITGSCESDDDMYYLFAIGSGDDTISAGSKPLASAPKGASLSMEAALNKDTPSSVLQSKFVAAVKIGSRYVIVTNGRYVTNPEAAAEYTYEFPEASSKKGLQVNTGMMDDVRNLGVKHAVINIVLNELLRNGDTPFVYNGTTYKMNSGYIGQLDREIRDLHNSGIIITAVILLQWDSAQKDLILPSARTSGYTLYGWNTAESGPRKKLEAACTYLAKRYAAQDKGVVNWVSSNEIDLWKDYHYCGQVSFDQYMKYSTDEYRLLYNSVKSVYSNARVYLSLDHTWTYTGRAGSYPSKQVLDTFASLLSREGALSWNLAFHPYPYPERDAAYWKLDSKVAMSADSPIITMMNLNYMTDYVRDTYGADKRIILSESGYSSVYNGVTSEENQAAAIAYGYYLAEFNDMVDSFVVHRHVDHKVETDMGFALGLWTNRAGAVETADRKKKAYDVFKYMDTDQYQKYTGFALPIIGKGSWEEAVPGFDSGRFL